MLRNCWRNFQKKATVAVLLVQEGQNKWCPTTWQNLIDYYKTSFISKLKTSERARQYSSLSALAIDKQEFGIDTKNIKALDVPSQQYINANDAFFLVNSNIKPTFGKISVLAFKNKNDALPYAKKYGGTIASFHDALALVEKNLKASIAYENTIYKKKTYAMGARIYKKSVKKSIRQNL